MKVLTTLIFLMFFSVADAGVLCVEIDSGRISCQMTINEPGMSATGYEMFIERLIGEIKAGIDELAKLESSNALSEDEGTNDNPRIKSDADAAVQAALLDVEAAAKAAADAATSGESK